MTRIRPALALALAAAIPFGAALASPDRRVSEVTMPTQVPVNAAAAISAVQGAGYTAVTEVEWEHGAWEVKAADAAGRRTELRVDPTTGAVSPRSR